MLGFINLNKPARLTSHDCVAKVRRLFKQKKVGHGGTLDPAATGVLPIAVGKATRLLSFLPEKKAYQARIRLGMRTNTDDLEGEVIETQPASHITLDQIQPLLSQFIGKIEQIPPAFSAIQREGKRLYELARKGENVEVPVRTVEVDKIEVLGWYPGEFPELEVAIACGAGTYIRAIARDLGTALNVGGTLAALIRTESCGMKLSDSLTLEKIEMQLQEGTFSLIPPAIALRHLPEIILSTSEAQRWCQGQKISIDDWQLTIHNPVRVNDGGGQFLGIGEVLISQSDRLLIPKIVIGNSEKP
ncbi:tRNA pseudouridine 55 synthase [Pleurocapsa sp. PCC 7327]|uniref:tRNA pseudouridine(55) synthase TruB n=1 Tax=Pleurocapsa sp. PCC 7327 TaxID=118163 RepID=UPI00029F8E66|nr:tRNA pseudouridine(55) synthase TruB [Pleurocapsa sp. PCC 7327]AFY78336.1 tRNA pseudouridine 55 synthase [Pleurocapsa sp. PCC 7327]